MAVAPILDRPTPVNVDEVHRYYLPLIKSIALKKYRQLMRAAPDRCHQYESEDFISLALVESVGAIKSFKPGRGFQFSTHLQRHLGGRLNNFIDAIKYQCHRPTWSGEYRVIFKRALKEHFNGEAEVAEVIDFLKAKMKFGGEVSNQTLAIAALGEEKCLSLHRDDDSQRSYVKKIDLSDNRSKSENELISAIDLQNALQKLKEHNERQYVTILMRYGLLDGKEYDLKEVAETWGVTPQAAGYYAKKGETFLRKQLAFYLIRGKHSRSA